VFLFLGFSLKDSEELKKQTKLQVGDVVDTLRQLVTASSQDLFYDKTDPEETKDMGKLINLNVVSGGENETRKEKVLNLFSFSDGMSLRIVQG
jgi:hypothetical protein